MVSTAEVSVALEGISFPASKQDMVRYVRERDAPERVQRILHQLPEREYRTMAEVWEEVGKIS